MLAKLMSGIRIAERALLAALMIGMSVLFFLNVVARELFPKLAVELAWVEEATLFALAWMVFVGLGLVLEQRRHIAMTAYSDTLCRPGPPRSCTRRSTSAASCSARC